MIRRYSHVQQRGVSASYPTGCADSGYAKDPGQEYSQMSLRSKVLSGLFWTGGAQLISQILTWAITIVVIRVLSPSDYGLLAMAMVVVGLLTLLSDGGLGAAVVQATELDDHKLR